jgi:hypothetical protein
MAICIKAMLFMLAFAITSFAKKGLDSIITIEVEKCKSQVTVDSTAFFAPIESLLAPLEKELPPMQQEFFDKCFYDYTEHCLLLKKEYVKKTDFCQNHYKYIYRRDCYRSQDVEIRAMITIGSLCNKLKEFTISYKKNGIGYDSTIYPNTGDWNVTERSAKATISRHSSGERIEFFYDEQGRKTGFFYLRANKDTMSSERYFWEKDKLVKTIIYGVERNYIYGSPCDSVIVEPPDIVMSDSDVSFSTTIYHKSFGLIPEEKDPEYENFKKGPYQYYDRTKLLEKQKVRCEEYKEKQKKKGNKK